MNISVKKIYVGLEEVATLLDLATSTIQKMVTKEEFPAPRLLTSRRVAWLLREVEDWAEQRPISDLPPPPNTGAKKPKAKQQVAQDELQAA
jgi:prophage regulatory protein